MADQKPDDERQHDEEANPAWERFRVFVSKVASVPKEEADEKREQEKQKKQAG